MTKTEKDAEDEGAMGAWEGGKDVAIDQIKANAAADKARIAMEELQISMAKKIEEEKAIMDELAKVKIDTEHVKILMNEFEIDKSKADRVLRENNGDFKLAVKAFWAM